MIQKVLRWLQTNFSPLLEPRYNYKQQEHINTSRVKMASMAMIHFGLDPGKFACFLGGEYTGYTRNVHRTLSVVKDHISPEDLAHMKWILMDGCLAELTFEEPLSNKIDDLERELKKLQQESRNSQKDNEQGGQVHPCHSSGHPNLSTVTIFEAHYANHGYQRRQKPTYMLGCINN
jgi:hypothetical protein